MAEQKRKSFQEIGVSSSHLDSASGISVNKWDTRNSGKQEYNGGNKQQKWGNKSVKSGGGRWARGRYFKVVSIQSCCGYLGTMCHHCIVHD